MYIDYYLDITLVKNIFVSLSLLEGPWWLKWWDGQ